MLSINDRIVTSVIRYAVVVSVLAFYLDDPSSSASPPKIIFNFEKLQKCKKSYF